MDSGLLRVAAKSRRFDVIKLLLKYPKANPNAKDSQAPRVLAFLGNVMVVKALGRIGKSDTKYLFQERPIGPNVQKMFSSAYLYLND